MELADPGRTVLALDFDGTLAPIVDDPATARAHPGAAPALARLAPHLAAVAVITGRPAELAVELGGFGDVPGLLVLGAYGAERWHDGTLTAPPVPPGITAVRPQLAALAERFEGVHLEDKGLALAVHTRRAPDPQQAFDALRAPLAELAAAHGLHLEPGRCVLELRPAGIDKGHALAALLADTGARHVVYAGDDLGDLAAFDAVDAFRAAGGTGTLVCSGSDEVTALADRADVTLDGPAAVVTYLSELADMVERR